MNGANWNVDIRAASAQEVRALIAQAAEIPEMIKAVIFAALDALPPDRGDLGVMVNSSGHIGSWEEYRRVVASHPQPKSVAKPQGFMSLWVGYTNTVRSIVGPR